MKKQLKDLVTLVGGYPFKSNLYKNSGIRVIRIANVQDGYISDEYPCFYPEEYKEAIGAAMLKDNDLLMSLTGNVGRVAFLTNDMLPAGLNQRVECLRTNNILLKRYLYFYFRSKKFIDEAIKNSSGIAQLNMSTKWLGDYSILLYDEDKMKRICEILELISNTINNKQSEIEYLNELIKSRFIEMFGDRLINLNKKMSSIATPVIGLTYKPSNVTKGGTIVLRSGNIQNNELQLEEDIVRVSNINISEQKWIKDKDILMCSRNGSARLVGKSCLIRHPEEQMSFGAFMTVVRTKYPYFLQGFFTSDYFKNQLTGVGTASVNQITSGMLNNYDVIEPTEVEEKEFESYVKQVDKSKFIA